jgi:rhamnogalacturonyl hydrolase YesR
MKKLNNLIESIKGEIELSDDPKEYNERVVLDSIKALIEQTKEVEYTSGYFKWIG